MAAARRIPPFAPQTFRQWFLSRPARPAADRARVILWPDTFNDHFHPETLRSAVDVLEEAGFSVEIPRASLCCGRPLYDFGMLGTARSYLQRILASLDREIAHGVPIVGLEPSCVSVFRDELTNLMPHVEQARRLRAQTFTLAELLTDHAPHMPALTLRRHAVVHGHCHHKAIVGMEAERRLLDRMGISYDLLDSGCCGMAGAFGFERGHYDVSMAIGERVLLPAVRAARGDTLIVADGFSCREQIAQATDRRALHLVDLLHMAMRDDERGPSGDRPERHYVRDYSPAALRPAVAAGAAAAAALAFAAGRVLFSRRRRGRSGRGRSPHRSSAAGAPASR